jgi:hypothetical protein
MPPEVIPEDPLIEAELRVEVWLQAMRGAAAHMVEVIKNPPQRKPDEMLAAWVERVQDSQAGAIYKWQRVRDEYMRSKRASRAAL